MSIPWIATVKKPFDWFDYAHHRYAQGREKRIRVSRVDSLLIEQVRGILQKADQKLILMVRG